MKRKILTMITTGCIFLMLLTGCGKSSANWTTADGAELSDGSEAEGELEEAGTITENQIDEKAGLYQPDGSFIPWNDLNIDVETDDSRNNLNVVRANRANNYNGELVFPDNITKIGNEAFCACTSLTSTDLSNTQITSIGENVFLDCTSLTSIDLPDTLTDMGRGAFKNCVSLTSIDLPDTLISIGGGAFYDCRSLTSVDLPDTLISIGSSAFSGCISLASIDLPNTLINIDECAFYDCRSLTNINYAGTMEEWYAIEKFPNWRLDSSLETITCSDGVIY